MQFTVRFGGDVRDKLGANCANKGLIIVGSTRETIPLSFLESVRRELGYRETRVSRPRLTGAREIRSNDTGIGLRAISRQECSEIRVHRDAPAYVQWSKKIFVR